MPDILIRDIPAEDLKRLDEQAERLGLSRNEFLRQRLHQEAERIAPRTTIEDLRRMAESLSDLGDESIMRDAWS